MIVESILFGSSVLTEVKLLRINLRIRFSVALVMIVQYGKIKSIQKCVQRMELERKFIKRLRDGKSIFSLMSFRMECHIGYGNVYSGRDYVK